MNKSLPVINPIHPMLQKRPTKREDCCDGPRPCPWVSCMFNTFVAKIDPAGRVIRRVPYSEPEDVDPKTSCMLDSREQGELTLKDIGEMFSLSRERIRQVQNQALRKLRRNPDVKQLRQFLEIDPAPGKGRNSEET